MIIYTAEDMVIEDEVRENISILTNIDTGTSFDDTSITHFCEFVDYYTRHSTDPIYTALTCEQQAEAIRITDQDLSPETIRLLIDTMLTAIDHLEKKWLDEQLQQEDVTQRYRSNLAQTPSTASNRTQETHGMKLLWRSWRQWMQTWFMGRKRGMKRTRRVGRRHVVRREAVA